MTYEQCSQCRHHCRAHYDGDIIDCCDRVDDPAMPRIIRPDTDCPGFEPTGAKE